MIEDHLINLIKKYLEGSCTPAEKLEVEDWFEQYAKGDRDFYNNNPELIHQSAQRVLGGIRERIAEDDEPLYETAVVPIRPIHRLWPRVTAAASVLLILSAGAWFAVHKQQPQRQLVQNQIHDIAPGGNKAILTLANGSKVSLTDAKNGSIASQGQVTISKAADGKLVYSNTANSTDQAANEAFNTITTPAGGHYNLVMADGTLVVLDAASSITYPVAFNGKERKVEITGQAYFEVVHNAAKPFKVMVRGETIEDIGTHFNINAFNDEPAIKTTLIEGSVLVSLNNNPSAKGVTLTPGQQAVAPAGSNTIAIKQVDTDDAVAWKNGYFQFTDEPLESVMRKISRWYNVGIEYHNSSRKSATFNGTISKYKNVSQVLKKLELTGAVHFNIKSNNIIEVK